MKILHISTRLILGGSQENTVLSCEGQAALGHDVHLAFGPIYGPEGSMLERVEAFRTADGRSITIHEIPDMVRQISPGRDRRCLSQLDRLVQSLKPDIVHTHSSKAGILGRWAAWKHRDTPTGVIHTIHGPPFHDHQSEWLNKVYVAAERFAARRCHRIVSVADAMTRQYLDRGIGHPEQYVTVRSGMETLEFLEARPGESRVESRAALGFQADDFVIGTVARLAELKGHDDVLDALAEDLAAHSNWKLLWIGDGWWHDRLMARVNEMGLTSQVCTTGLVPSEQVPRHIRAMDVLVHPSYREGLPRTVPQALLCGVIPVAYDVDGTGEACRDGQTGRLIRPGDTDGLREAVRWVAAYRDQAAALARAGREMCREEFSADAMVARLEEVCSLALADARAGVDAVPRGARSDS